MRFFQRLSLITSLLLFGCSALPAQAFSLSWPISTDNPTGSFQSFFGPRIKDGAYDFHRGIDLDGEEGSPILAAASGTVVGLYEDGDPDSPYPNSGNVLVLKHTAAPGVRFHNQRFTTIYTHYLHLSTFASGMAEGALVSTGETIGSMGQTGDTEDTHLHFEVRIGSPCSLAADCNTVGFDPHVNPLRFLSYSQRNVPDRVRLRRKGKAIRVSVRLPKNEYDLNRIRVASLGKNGTVLRRRTIDFNTRTSIDASSQSAIDTALHNNVKALPVAIDSTAATHRLTVSMRKIITPQTKKIRVTVRDTKGNIIYKNVRPLHRIRSLQ